MHTPIARLAEAFGRSREVRAQQDACEHDLEQLPDEDWMGMEYARCAKCQFVSAV